MHITDSVESIRGVGDALAQKFHNVGVKTVEDLLSYYPRRYNDFSHIVPIAKMRPGEVTLQGTFKQITGRYVRGGLHITEAVLSDKSSSVRVVWFNQPYRSAGIKTDEEYYVSGMLDLKRGRMVITNPSCELVSDFPVNTARIIPIYREVKGLKSTAIRKIIKTVLTSISDVPSTIPAEIARKYKLINRKQALGYIHFPATLHDVEHAKYRLGFEELFELILASTLLRNEVVHEKAIPIPFDRKVAQKFVRELSFTLTDSQRATIWEIYQDMAKPHPMNRLVEGDVGAGKTVVAAMAALMTAHASLQTAFMAPTELLARQHAETLYQLMLPLGQQDGVVLLVGSMNAKQKKAAYQRIASGDALLIVGTHALLQEKLDMHSLGLVIVDEQHRFGVEQRKALLKKVGHVPHMLTMTATPIPRSLALTVYGELDISIIRQKPKDRKPIVTKIIKHSYAPDMYEDINSELARGRQAFVVCPLIDPSTSMALKSASEVQKQLQQGPLKQWKIGLLHGKMKADEKTATMQDFINRKLDVLVATTVIEVGVDIPNATVMVIQSPERFGLAQIHQLRGRVGRSEHQGYCYLLLDDDSAPSKRLRALEQSADGFRLAELDLQLRGPGAIYGRQQHGALDLRMVELTDTSLIKAAREAALACAQKHEYLLQYPQLQERITKLQKVIHLN